MVVSGTKIADEIGTGRSEVWRLVQQLRTLGVEIAGHPATGYQLKSVPDLLLPDMLAPALKGTIFGADVHRNYHHYYKIGSTNVEAMEAPPPARRRAAFSWPKNKPPDAGAARITGNRRLRRESTVRWCCVRRCRRRKRWCFRWLRGWRCTQRYSRSTPESRPI